MSKYSTLVNIIDKIRSEATSSLIGKYNPHDKEIDKTTQARARAFIHLYLKVSFGILDFSEREYFITDGSYDGGIDGYYINGDNKTIYFVQSKFRINEINFENKEINLEEVLVMDINRILDAEECDEQGNQYNGKIKQLIRDVTKIEDIARYKYQVIILANLDTKIPQSKLRYLTGGYPVEVFNYEKCYEKLVFPVISGTFFNATDLNIFIDLSNKNAGSKISYTVQTAHNECEITVLFVPTIEVAKILHKYKNSILKYNPRSYLEFEGQKVNTAIRDTILNNKTNEFALFNNGITMLSDETYINEKIGQKNKAQLTVKNPQIINGGQTTFTLSRIYEEYINNNVIEIFQNKEVLLKIITLLDVNGNATTDIQKLELIDDISTATNQQTPVINADKFSNDKIHMQIQQKLFDRYGILYERKRGEFGDGLNKGYITLNQIIERNHFFRIYHSSNGSINKVTEKRLFLRHTFTEHTIADIEKLDNFYFGYLCFKKLSKTLNPNHYREKNLYGQIYALTKKYKPNNVEDFENALNQGLKTFDLEWNMFVEEHTLYDTKHVRTYIDKDTQMPRKAFSISKWYRSSDFENDVKKKFG